MNKRITKNASSFSSKVKLTSIVLFLTLSLGLLIGVINTPQDIRQRAQNAPARTPPQCAATGGQQNTGVCVPATQGCLPGEEQEEGQLDCAAGQTCCSLAEVPQECADQSNGQTFCSTAANCTGLYNGQNLGQLGCDTGVICCKNPTFPTTTPTPTEKPEPTVTEEPTPTFGSISGPNDPNPTDIPNPQDPQNPPQQTPPATQDGGLLQIILLLISLILAILGR